MNPLDIFRQKEIVEEITTEIIEAIKAADGPVVIIKNLTVNITIAQGGGAFVNHGEMKNVRV